MRKNRTVEDRKYYYGRIEMNKFKVLLVYPNLQLVTLIPSNIAILSAYLKRAGIDVKLFDTTFYQTEEKSVDEIRVEHLQLRPFNFEEKGVGYKETDIFEDFQEVVNEYRPDIIAVSATDITYDLGVALISKLKNRKAHVIFGGVHPTFAPERVIQNKNIDSICIGEGEEALLELCEKMRGHSDITKIKNVWVKLNGEVYRNEVRALIDLNNIPYEDFTVFEEKRFFRPMQGKLHRMIPVSIDRGCPFNCSFCAAPLKRKLYRDSGYGQYYRVKEISNVISELEFQVEKYKADYIYFNSETFFARKEKDIERFAKEYSAKIGLPFWCQTRIETITDKRIRLLEDMNCDRISIGLEHGNEEFRKNILDKNFSNEQVIKAFAILEKRRIPVSVNNMIGFPDETRDLVFDTIKLNRRIKADSINAFFFVPYTGTPLRKYCIEKKFFDPQLHIDGPMIGSSLDMPQLSSEQIKGLVRTFPLYVKMPESYFEKIKVAEQLNEEGDAMFAELSDLYFNKYFK